jgi:ERCC4-type nuclease
MQLDHVLNYRSLSPNNEFFMLKPSIVADYREVPSGIPNILKEMGADLQMEQLKSGDYILHNEVMVERKSRDDFALSIIQGRLFAQCARMRKSDKHAVMLIEGNPYQTKHEMERQAIKGGIAIGFHLLANTYSLFGPCPGFGPNVDDGCPTKDKEPISFPPKGTQPQKA